MVVNKTPIAVESEVGIGKSIAYLVPIILQYFRERRQIIITTSTIALQEQLEKDVHTVLRMIGVKAEVILAIGMKNYICRKMLHNYTKRSCYDKETVPIINDKADGGEQFRTRMGIEIHDELWNRICINGVGEKCKNC